LKESWLKNTLMIMEKDRQEVRQGISDSEIDTFKRVLIQINKNMNPENG